MLEFRQKILQLLFIFLGWPLLIYAQKNDGLKLYNAYYLAKNICKPHQQLQKQDALKILGGIYWYAGEDSVGWSSGADTSLFSRYDKLGKKANYLKRMITDLTAIYKIDPIQLIEFKKKYSDDKGKIDTIATLKKSIEEIKNRKIAMPFDTKKINDVANLVRTIAESLKVDSSGQLITNEFRVNYKDFLLRLYSDTSFFSVDTIHSLMTIVDSSSLMYNKLTKKIDSVYSTLSEQLKEAISIEYETKTNSQWENKYKGELQSEFQSAVQQYARSNQSEESPAPTQTLGIGLQMPSEAQMINALAIYLSTRVKQEAVLWFFDMLRKDAGKYELIKTAFPECTRLLQSAQVFETPNLGSGWKYALAKDFATLPENILQSQWLANRLPEDSKYLTQYFEMGVKTARLIQEKFSYRDVIRRLYLDAQIDNNLPDTAFYGTNNMLTVLYAVTNEMYTINSVKGTTNMRLLSYEDLRSMTAEETEIMMSLIDMKYNGIIAKLWRKNFAYNRKDADSIAYWVGKITLTIGQFDKINNEFRQLREQSKNPDYQFTYYNVWKLLSEVLKTIYPYTKSADTKKGNVKKNFNLAINCLSDLNEAFELISNKNYIGSVSKVLNILDALVYTDTLTIRLPAVLKKDIGTLKITTLKDEYSKTLKELAAVDTSSNTKLMVASLLKGADDLFNPKSSLHNRLPVRNSNYGTAYVPDLSKYVANGSVTIKQVGDTSVVTIDRKSLASVYFVADDRKAIQMLQKMASFLNDVSLANNEKQLSRVVNSYAMPPGSYKRKRNTWSSLDLNAFVGIYGGYEIIPGNTQYLKTDNKNAESYKDKGFVYGISAPIGITYSHTWGKKLNSNCSLTPEEIASPDAIKIGKKHAWRKSGITTSFTLSVIDIGAVVSYRLDKQITGDTSFAPHDFKWAQLLSPGLHANIGLCGTPLVFSIGAQFTPQLRKVEDGGLDLLPRQLNTFRFYGGFYFDIPMFNLWTRERVIKN